MEFKEQFWLILIPVVLAIMVLLYVANARGRKMLIRRFASGKLVRDLLSSYSPARHKLKRILVLFGLAALLVALARPILGYDWRETKSKGIDILFVLDSSRSMLAKDIRPNRLERAKLAILDFIGRLEGDRVGLVAFAGEAFLQCPLTLDYNAFEQSLQAVDTSIISTGGTDIALAITEAENAFKDDSNYKILVLITDGEDLEADGIERARQAAANGVTIYTVGVGTPEGEVIPVMDRFGRMDYLRDADGKVVTTKLDEDTLAQIAEVTDGFYVPLGSTGFGLEQVYEAGLESIPEEELSAQMERIGIERFQWPLGLAILLLAWEPLIGTRRRLLRRKGAQTLSNTAVFLLVLTAVTLSQTKLEAQQQPAQELPVLPVPDEAVEGDSEEAELEELPSFEDPRDFYNQGNRLYAEGKYAAAVQSWQQALNTLDLSLQADAFYNLGNARFRQGAETLSGAPHNAQLEEADQQAFGAADEAMRSGNAVLEAATANQIPAALRNQQAQQATVPQEQIQQAIQVAEQAKTASEEAKESDLEAKEGFAAAAQSWEQSLRDYQSAQELSELAEDAAHNAAVVSRRLAELSSNLKAREKAIERHQLNAENLEKLIEELKKLLEDQENDQNQDPQNQDQQQDQDQQNQDQQQGDSGDQSDQQQGDGGDQSDQQDSQGEQNQQQDSSQEGQQNQDQSEGSEQEQDQASEEKGSDEGSSGQGEQTGDQTNNNSGEQEGDSQQANPEQSGQEDSQSGEQEQVGEDDQQRKEGQPGQEPIELSEEEAEELSERAAAQEGKEGNKEEGATSRQAGEPVQLGVMSREQARRFLESIKDEEKKLPVSGYGPLKYRVDEQGKRKDW